MIPGSHLVSVGTIADAIEARRDQKRKDPMNTASNDLNHLHHSRTGFLTTNGDNCD